MVALPMIEAMPVTLGVLASVDRECNAAVYGGVSGNDLPCADEFHFASFAFFACRSHSEQASDARCVLPFRCATV
jgi:hypothetical protein